MGLLSLYSLHITPVCWSRMIRNSGWLPGWSRCCFTTSIKYRDELRLANLPALWKSYAKISNVGSYWKQSCLRNYLAPAEAINNYSSETLQLHADFLGEPENTSIIRITSYTVFCSSHWCPLWALQPSIATWAARNESQQQPQYDGSWASV